MMVRTWDGNRLLRRALVASLAVHVLIAVFLPTWMPPQSEGLQPVESFTFARIMRVVMQRPATHSLPVSVPDTSNRARQISFARTRSELSVSRPKASALPTAQNGPAGKVAAAPKHVALHKPAPLYARPPDANAQISTQRSLSAQTPQPETTVQDRPAGGAAAADRGGVLPLGERQDPVLDPNALAKLQSVNVHVTLIVTVGDDGHTKHIEFQPPLDDQTERAIETILADANWDAAVCGGGVSCEGTATIKL